MKKNFKSFKLLSLCHGEAEYILHERNVTFFFTYTSFLVVNDEIFIPLRRGNKTNMPKNGDVKRFNQHIYSYEYPKIIQANIWVGTEAKHNHDKNFKYYLNFNVWTISMLLYGKCIRVKVF